MCRTKRSPRHSLTEPLLSPKAPPNPASLVDDEAEYPDMMDIGCHHNTGSFAVSKCSDPIKLLFQGVSDPHSIIKGFVRSAINGFVVDTFTTKGGTHPADFRLSRDVDAFEVASHAGRQPCKVALTDITNIQLGDASWIQIELGHIFKGLDSQCAVVELSNGDCLALRFGSGDGTDNVEQAKTFVRCMQTLAIVLRQQANIVLTKRTI